MKWQGETETRCMGRFCLAVPKEMKFWGGGVVQYVGLEEQPWPEPRESAFGRAWKAKLEEIAKLGMDFVGREPDNFTGKMIERRTFKSGVFEGVLYHPPPGGDWSADWVALVDAGSSGLWLSRETSPADSAEDVAAIVQIGSAYRARKPGEVWPVPGADYFYLEHGFLALPFHRQEITHMYIDAPGIQFELEAWSVANPERDMYTLVEKSQHGQDVLARLRSNDTFAPAKHGSRTVAGLKGEEMWHRSEDARWERKSFDFEWLYHGELNSGNHPFVNIKMDASLDGETVKESDEKEQRAKALWNHLLDSMRPAAEVR